MIRLCLELASARFEFWTHLEQMLSVSGFNSIFFYLTGLMGCRRMKIFHHVLIIFISTPQMNFLKLPKLFNIK